jgi:hypothetical protein
MIQEKQDLTPAVWSMVGAILNDTTISKPDRADKGKKLLFCFENGLPLNLAFNGGLYIVNNKMAVEGDIIRAKINNSSNYDFKIEKQDETGCTLSFWQRANENWNFRVYDSEAKNGDWVKKGETSFTLEDAKRAGLITGSKDTYSKYPTDMFFNRATSRMYKRFCSDLFNQSVYIHGEIEGTDFNNDDFLEGEIIQPQTTLDNLVNRFAPDAILTANNGRMPSTQAEIDTVMAKLSEENNG